MLYLLELIKRNKTAFWIIVGVGSLFILSLVFGTNSISTLRENIYKERDAYYAEVLEKKRKEQNQWLEEIQNYNQQERSRLESTIEELNKKMFKLESEKSSKTQTKIVTKEKIIMPDGTIIEKEESKDVSEIIQSKLSQLEEENNKKLQTQVTEVESKYESMLKTKEETHTKEVAELKESFKNEKEILMSEVSKETKSVDRLFVTGGVNLDKNILSSVYVKVLGNIFVGVSTEFGKDGFKDLGLNVGIKF